jgi:hypothetical protein
MKSYLTTLLLLVGTFLAQAQPPAIIVTTTADTLSTTDGQTSLREALAYAATLTGAHTITFSNSSINGAVNFHDGMAHTITLGGSQLSITSNVTITGPGAHLLTISGNEASRVFLASENTNVSMSGLTITHGRITGATVGIMGGGILSFASQFTLADCVIRSNSAVGVGPANGFGGGICSRAGLLTLERCLISDNTAMGETYAGADGGGIYCVWTFLRLIDCTVKNNLAGSGAHANVAGGGIFSTLGDCHLARCTFSGNTAIGGDNAAIWGGGILARYGNLKVTSCTFSGNKARGGNGGSVRGGGVSYVSDTSNDQIALSSCTLSGNSADGGGTTSIRGGGFYKSGSGTMLMQNTVLHRGNGSGTNVFIDAFSNGITSLGYNISSDFTGPLTSTDLRNTDPQLGPLADNGGPTFTHGLLPNSPAIDAGDPAFAPNNYEPPLTTDQRGVGFPRILRGKGNTIDARIDIGAYETSLPPLEVRGNGLIIANGDSTPTHADHTDFGPVPFANTNTMQRTFSIRTVGTIPLVIGSASISGTHSSDFTLTSQPAGPAAPGEPVKLFVSFRPGGYGPRTALITVGGIASEHAPFTFTIAGFGANSTPTSIILNGGVIKDASTPGTFVGSFIASDPDSDDEHVFSLQSSEHPDHTSFSIIGNKLIFEGTADLATKPVYFIRVRVTDNGAPAQWHEQVFQIAISPLDPEFVIHSPLVLNPQTGLFEYWMRLTNPGQVSSAGVRVTLMNLPTTLQLWNRTHPVLPILEDATPLGPNLQRDLLIQFYSPLRRLPAGWTPIYKVEALYDGTPNLAGDASGQYAALIEHSTEARLSRVPLLGGRVTVTVSRFGGASGVVWEGAVRRAFRGHLEVDTTLPHLPALRVPIGRDGTRLELIFLPDQHQVRGRLVAANTGVITTISPPSTPETPLSGWRRVWHAQNRPATSFHVRHHLALTNQDLTQGPQGFGYLVTRVLNRDGRCVVSGRLPDGQVVSGAAFLGPLGEVPLYASLYHNAGSFRGWLTLSTDPLDNTALGTLYWLKPETTAGPAFGPVKLNAEGGAWQQPAPGALVMNLDPSSPGVANALVELSLGPVSVDQAVRVASPASGRLPSPVTVLPPNSQSLTFSAISNSTGLWGGTLKDGRLHGLIVPTRSDGILGFGFYLHRNSTGRAELLPNK